MDNLTHSLIGAVLGQAGLKRRTRAAMPALIIAANLPDIDVFGRLFGWQSRVVHRGLTHGLGGMLLLPPLLACVLLLVDRWRQKSQAARGRVAPDALPMRPLWLLALCTIAMLTHPAFDWLNNYGIRLLEPFGHGWYYGDALFIVDVWLLAMLGAGVGFSRARESAGRADWAAPALVAIVGVALYVGANLLITARAEGEAASALAFGQAAPMDRIAANPVPLAFWRREVLWRRADESYGALGWSLFARAPRAGDADLHALGRTGMDDPRVARWSSGDPQARAFLFWARMPIVLPDAQGLDLADQRFLRFAGRGALAVRLKPR